MASGHIFPFSAYVLWTEDGFPRHHLATEGGLGVYASLSSDATWYLRFMMPPTLPTGTGKLRLLALATATSGAAKVNPKWVSVAVGENPYTATRLAEGTTTVTWGAGDSDEYKETVITLNADTLAADEIVVMNLTFETVSWTLAVPSTWIPSIFWE